jgi:hypothetical protein
MRIKKNYFVLFGFTILIFYLISYKKTEKCMCKIVSSGEDTKK